MKKIIFAFSLIILASCGKTGFNTSAKVTISPAENQQVAPNTNIQPTNDQLASATPQSSDDQLSTSASQPLLTEGELATPPPATLITSASQMTSKMASSNPIVGCLSTMVTNSRVAYTVNSGAAGGFAGLWANRVINLKGNAPYWKFDLGKNFIGIVPTVSSSMTYLDFQPYVNTMVSIEEGTLASQADFILHAQYVVNFFDSGSIANSASRAKGVSNWSVPKATPGEKLMDILQGTNLNISGTIQGLDQNKNPIGKVCNVDITEDRWNQVAGGPTGLTSSVQVNH